MKKITKKKVTKSEYVPKMSEVTGTPFVPEKKMIGLLSLNLGREDLNQMVEKLNEVINKLNEC